MYKQKKNMFTLGWSSKSSALGRLHHVLELQEGLVSSLSIALRHLGHHVWADILAQVELGNCVVDVHGLGASSRCNHVSDGGVDGSVVCQGVTSLESMWLMAVLC